MITAIVLAAGRSARLGRPKQLLDLQGKPVLRHVVEAAEASPVDEIVVVLGHAAREIAAAVPLRGRVRVAFNPDYEAGQSASLRTGLRAADAGSQAAVVLLGDQPGVRPETVRSVVEAWRSGSTPIVQAAYGGRPGHPTLFAREVWPDAEAVEGDEGARGVIAAHPEWRTVVEVGGSPPDDIDTEQDYQRVREAFGRTRSVTRARSRPCGC